MYKFPTVKEIAEFSQSALSCFWEEYLRLDMPALYKVDLSQKLYELKTEMIAKIRARNESGENADV